MSRTGRRWLLAIAVIAVVVGVAIGSGSTTGQSAEPNTTTTPSITTSTASSTTVMTSTSTTLVVTTSTTTPTPTTTTPAPVAAAPVDRLVVATPAFDLAPYRRKAFGDGWDYDPATGCNTRELVLIDESATPPVLRDRCHPVSGSWRSAYDGVATTNPDNLEIDHFVPLADAWRSGAAAWTDEERRTFANDRTDPATLIAVTSRTNRSKSDRTPDEWLPPDPTDRCAYATDWVAVKLRWQLAVTGPEKAVLTQILAGC